MKFPEIQNKIKKFIAEGDSSVAEHIALAKELSSVEIELPEYVRKIKVAFLSNFTLLGLPEVFRVQAIPHNIAAETYLGEYNQYAQEILNPESGLNKFKPKLIYFLIDPKDTDQKQIDQLVGAAKSNLGAKMELITDFSGFAEHWYTKYKDLGDMRLALDAFPAFAEKLMGQAIAVSGATKKCLVLDLDNTLWAGVVGEDGADKVIPNKKLQEHILGLYKKGVILAINSKNNEADAMEVLEKHPEMILRKNHFAAWQINWRDKATNIRAIADELSLGSDSFVFVDDDLFQQSLVAESCPEVAVLHPDNLFDYPGFSTNKLTIEDMRRGEMYAEERTRRSLQSSLKSVDDFLKELNLEVTIKNVRADSPTIPRISQMTQKTNQFNLTTNRWQEEEVKAKLNNGWKMWTVEAVDRFGDYGTIGFLSVAPKNNSKWEIDNFLMSCRILGRGIEKAFLANLIENARKSGVKELVGVFAPTRKNKTLCENFYGENNFRPLSETGGVFYHQYNFSNEYPYPELIKVNFA
ncbi:MAG: HAD-IIIC family phosphatase [bacterium]|nr:HAD-IIIC family phosphatase [bacterium]